MDYIQTVPEEAQTLDFLDKDLKISYSKYIQTKESHA